MKPVVLLILDGWGHSEDPSGNAIFEAQTPNLDNILKYYPSLLLQASGPAVGMTWGEPGNSEVGHLTIGSGRIVFQHLNMINKSMETGHFYNLPVFLESIEHVKKNNSTLNIAGLLTSGAVHAHFNHLTALIKMAKENRVKFKLHLFTDGKDSGLKETPNLIQKLKEEAGEEILSSIATLMGRETAMNRVKNWSETKKAYDLMTKGIGQKGTDIFNDLKNYYENGITDNNIPATVYGDNPVIADNDSLIFFNFREDSMRQIVEAFNTEAFDYFQRDLKRNLFIVMMTRYINSAGMKVAFERPGIINTLPEIISANGKRQFHIAETEKYAHVTYFFNGLRDKPFDGETDFFLESPEFPTKNPAMMAADIASKITEELAGNHYDFIIANFANGDTLSHTGDFKAAIKGVEAVDKAIGTIKENIIKKEGVMIITSDHGNAESMVYRITGEKETRHDQNPVPFHLVAKEYERLRTEEEISSSLSEPKGLLADIAPTILQIIGIKKPAEMTGESLLNLLYYSSSQ